MESLALRQVESNALRNRRLSDTRHAEDRCEPVLDHGSYHFLHLALSAYEFRDFCYLKRIRRFLLDQLMLALAERTKNAALMLLLYLLPLIRFLLLKVK